MYRQRKGHGDIAFGKLEVQITAAVYQTFSGRGRIIVFDEVQFRIQINQDISDIRFRIHRLMRFGIGKQIIHRLPVGCLRLIDEDAGKQTDYRKNRNEPVLFQMGCSDRKACPEGTPPRQ